MRNALSCYASIEPADWRFQESDFGRPEIVSPESAPSLRFNLSHTDGFVACVITARADCGVDIESLSRQVDILGVADHSFSDEEADALRVLATPQRRRHFFSLWTLKEAYVKARGVGIRLRLDAARFEISRDSVIQCRLAAATRDRATEWQFALFAPSTNHLLATALRCDGGRRMDIACRTLDFKHDEVRELTIPLIAWTGT